MPRLCHCSILFGLLTIIATFATLLIYFTVYVPQVQLNGLTQQTQANISAWISEPVTCSDGSECYQHLIVYTFYPNETLVLNSALQTISVKADITHSAEWTDSGNPVGTFVDIYYDICWLDPIEQSSINLCGQQPNSTEFTTFSFIYYDTDFDFNLFIFFLTGSVLCLFLFTCTLILMFKNRINTFVRVRIFGEKDVSTETDLPPYSPSDPPDYNMVTRPLHPPQYAPEDAV
jgi:hypothetical protein